MADLEGNQETGPKGRPELEVSQEVGLEAGGIGRPTQETVDEGGTALEAGNAGGPNKAGSAGGPDQEASGETGGAGGPGQEARGETCVAGGQW